MVNFKLMPIICCIYLFGSLTAMDEYDSEEDIVNLLEIAHDYRIDTTITRGEEKEIIVMLQSIHSGCKCDRQVKFQDENVPLIFVAAARGHVKVLEYLRAHGIDLNSIITQGRYKGFAPVYFAVMHGQIEAIEYLRLHGINLNITITQGTSAGCKLVHIAATNNRIAVLKYLQSHQLDLDAQVTEGGAQGYTALSLAVLNKCQEAVRFLVGQGVNLAGLRSLPLVENNELKH